jgi:hypothetical protein
MKKNVFIILSGLIMFAMAGCSGSLTAVQYNDKVIAIHDATNEYVRGIINQLDNETLTVESKQLYADSIKIKIDGWATEIKAIKAPKSAEAFHAAVLKYFEFQQSEVAPVLQKLLLSANNDDFDTNVEAFNMLVDKDEVMSNELGAAQKVFAEKNNITLYY